QSRDGEIEAIETEGAGAGAGEGDGVGRRGVERAGVAELEDARAEGDAGTEGVVTVEDQRAASGFGDGGRAAADDAVGVDLAGAVEGDGAAGDVSADGERSAGVSQGSAARAA